MEKPLDDTLMFAEESKDSAGIFHLTSHFKLLIVDDENDVHVMTKLVLSDYQYKGSGLEFISAFSGAEARERIREHPDIACCLLDVVMETKDAGLEVARFIREEAKNHKMRIILRTGQPGKAPEKKVILNYDINDYKEKTELTTQKLFTTITTALRSYIHLEELAQKTKEIQTKNLRLNEEIARRIVAESNLTKYNRSLERMIENKSLRLKEALASLEKTEKELFAAKNAAIVSDLSAASLETVDSSNTSIESNLALMNTYRQKMIFLLEKYNTLEMIIASQKGTRADLRSAAQKSVDEINQYKSEIDFSTILEKYPGIIEDSIKGIQAISRAVSDIKLFVGINNEAPDATDINTLIARMAQKFEHGGIEIQQNLEDLPVLSLPKSHVRQALEHLLENAVLAVQPRGIIAVSTRFRDSRIQIEIRDVGQGIPEKMAAHIFTPYYSGWTEKRKGLGLCYARSVALSLGGDLTFDSTPNEGTTVVFTLPVHVQA